MKLNAVGISASNMHKTVAFYSLLGFSFPEKIDGQHVEAVQNEGSARLMIDSTELMEEIIGEAPVPANTSAFAVEYESASAVNAAAQAIESGGFTVFKQPWDAFWGQRYAIVEDPDGYRVDLYAALKSENSK